MELEACTNLQIVGFHTPLSHSEHLHYSPVTLVACHGRLTLSRPGMNNFGTLELAEVQFATSLAIGHVGKINGNLA